MPFNIDKQLNVVTADGHADFFNAAYAGNTYSLYLTATTSTVAAGNIEAAAAAASTQFALWNPLTSLVAISILKFGMGIISGTPTGGGLTHSMGLAPTVAASGTVYNHRNPLSVGVTSPTPSAGYMASAGGSALTGGGALKAIRVANFSQTATAAAIPGTVQAVEVVDGDIVLLPGYMWVPTWRGAGTSVLNNYSVTWEEITI